MSSSFFILVGSFSSMISTLNFTPSPPSLSLVTQTAAGTSPSWLLANPTNSSIVYATDETDTGALNSFIVDHTSGSLTHVDSIPTQGGSPTHIGLVGNGTQLGAANYGGKSAFFTTLQSDQLHFSNPQLVNFQGTSGSNPHEIVPFGDQVLVSDLGADRVWRLVHDASNSWSVQDFIAQPSGSHPRHIVVDDGSLYCLHEAANTLTQQSISPFSTDAQPNAASSISIVPSDTSSSATLLAGELLFAQNPTPLLYASNRDDPSPQGDAIAIFELNPLNKVAEVRTGLKHLRGVALIGDDDAYLIAGGMNGGGIKVYERVSADQGYLKEIAAIPAGVVDQPSSFVSILPQGSILQTSSGTVANSPTQTSTTSVTPSVLHSGCKRRLNIGF